MFNQPHKTPFEHMRMISHNYRQTYALINRISLSLFGVGWYLFAAPSGIELGWAAISRNRSPMIASKHVNIIGYTVSLSLSLSLSDSLVNAIYWECHRNKYDLHINQAVMYSKPFAVVGFSASLAFLLQSHTHKKLWRAIPALSSVLCST